MTHTSYSATHSGPGLLGVGAIILDNLLEKEELKKL